MRNIFEKFNLQFFADGVPGDAVGVETSTDVIPADVGQDSGVIAAAGQNVQARSLESLGVPKDLAEKHRALKSKNAPARKAAPAAVEVEAEPAAAPIEQKQEGQQVAAAASTEAGQGQNETNTFDWDELKKHPEFQRRMSEVISGRVKGLQGQLDAMAPMLTVLGDKFGIDTSDPAKTDYAALSKAVVDSDWFYEDAASRAGEDVGVFKKNAQRSMELDARSKEITRQEDAFKGILEQVAARNYQEKLKADAAILKAQFPNFDLDKEMENPRFAAMVSLGGGLTVQQAYRALHYAEIEKRIETETAQRVQKAITSSIQSGRHIPAENGTARMSAAPAANKPYSQMDKAERQQYRDGLRNGSIRY